MKAVSPVAVIVTIKKGEEERCASVNFIANELSPNQVSAIVHSLIRGLEGEGGDDRESGPSRIGPFTPSNQCIYPFSKN